MLYDMADDHDDIKFVEDYVEFQSKWSSKLRFWWELKKVAIKIWWSKIRYPRYLVPPGQYCYTHLKIVDENAGGIVSTRKCVCPYWQIKPDQPYRRNGYCKLLGWGDWEVGTETYDSLLWDQVKQCGINETLE